MSVRTARLVLRLTLLVVIMALAVASFVQATESARIHRLEFLIGVGIWVVSFFALLLLVAVVLPAVPVVVARARLQRRTRDSDVYVICNALVEDESETYVSGIFRRRARFKLFAVDGAGMSFWSSQWFNPVMESELRWEGVVNTEIMSRGPRQVLEFTLSQPSAQVTFEVRDSRWLAIRVLPAGQLEQLHERIVRAIVS